MAHMHPYPTHRPRPTHILIQYNAIITHLPEGESSVSGGKLESARGMPGGGATSDPLLSPRSACTADSDRWMLR